MNEIDFDLN